MTKPKAKASEPVDDGTWFAALVIVTILLIAVSAALAYVLIKDIKQVHEQQAATTAKLSQQPACPPTDAQAREVLGLK